MDLPLTLQMEIDISARAHKLEIAEAFAKLRASHAPTPRERTAQELRDMALTQGAGNWYAQQQYTPQNWPAFINPCQPVNASLSMALLGFELF